MKVGYIRAFVAVAFAGCLSGMAYAQDVTKLKFASFLPSNHTCTVQGSNVFMEAAKKASGGTLDFEFYPGEQAGKALQLFDLVKSGAIDIAEVSGGYISSDKSPLLGIMELPGPKLTTCKVAAAMKVMAAPGGLIYQGDFVPSGVRAIAFYPYPAYGPAASRKKISSVEDMQGMKMRNAGGLQELTVRAVGGVPVKIPSPEVYESLQRGTLDTVLFSFLSVREYDLASVAKFGATGWSFGTPGTLTFISERTFQSLPKKTQDALLQAGNVSSDNWCHYVDAKETEYIADARKQGMDIYKWSDTDVARLNKLTASIPSEWAKDLDSRGKPGTKVLEKFRELTGAGD